MRAIGQLKLKKNFTNANEIENIVYEYTVKNSPETIENIENTYLRDIYVQTIMKLIINKDKITKYSLNELCTLTREQMYPEKWTNLEELRSDFKGVKNGMHRCQKCNSWHTEHQELQTASADESMRVSVVCLNCGNRWKYN